SLKPSGDAQGSGPYFRRQCQLTGGPLVYCLDVGRGNRGILCGISHVLKYDAGPVDLAGGEVLDLLDTLAVQAEGDPPHPGAGPGVEPAAVVARGLAVQLGLLLL